MRTAIKQRKSYVFEVLFQVFCTKRLRTLLTSYVIVNLCIHDMNGFQNTCTVLNLETAELSVSNFVEMSNLAPGEREMSLDDGQLVT